MPYAKRIGGDKLTSIASDFIVTWIVDRKERKTQRWHHANSKVLRACEHFPKDSIHRYVEVFFFAHNFY